MLNLSTFDLRKYQLIHYLLSLEDERVLTQIEQQIAIWLVKPVIQHPAIKPLRNTTTVEKLQQEQNYQGFHQSNFDTICNDFELTTPLEELLAMM